MSFEYIKTTKKNKERKEENNNQQRSPSKHLDKDGQTLTVGDNVVLLTKGVDNNKYTEGTVVTSPP